MGYYSRLSKSFEGALRLPLTNTSRYVLIGDCHRGTGTQNDNFLKNKHIYYAALQYYYRNGFTYIEMGDGDDLWENRSFEQIFEAHKEVFELLSLFRRQNRLFMLYGNHDMIKKTHPEFFPDMTFYSSIILGNPPFDIYLTHGHQTDLFNSDFWKLSRFLVRYIWKPLEHLGISDPTSAAKNYKRKKLTEKRLNYWAENEKHILITGHTHRPVLYDTGSYYCNCGCCVHPYSITCIEIEQKNIRLVKWSVSTRADMMLGVRREVIEQTYYFLQ